MSDSMKRSQKKRTQIKREKAVTFFLAALLLAGCSGKVEDADTIIMVEQEENTVAYSMATAAVGDVVSSCKLKCTYQQRGGQEVSFSLSGREIAHVYVEEGDSVVKGQLLAELSSGNREERMETLRYQIERNRLLLEHADVNENNDISSRWAQYVYQSGQSEREKTATEDDVAEIRRQYRYIREDCQDAIDLDSQELAELEQEDALSRVYAQMDGTLSWCMSDLEGATSTREEIIMKIMDSTQCLFAVENAEYAAYFKENETIGMNIVSGIGAGSYELLPYRMEQWEDTLLFQIAEGDATAIQVGTTGTMQLTLEERNQVLHIPAQALHRAENGYYVYVVGADKLREVRWVEVGLQGDSNVEITSGLTEGEKVILK